MTAGFSVNVLVEYLFLMMVVFNLGENGHSQNKNTLCWFVNILFLWSFYLTWLFDFPVTVLFGHQGQAWILIFPFQLLINERILSSIAGVIQLNIYSRPIGSYEKVWVTNFGKPLYGLKK